MQTAVKTPNKQIGKSELTYKIVEWAILANKKLFIGTSNPDNLYNILKSKYPQSDIKKHKDGISING